MTIETEHDVLEEESAFEKSLSSAHRPIQVPVSGRYEAVASQVPAPPLPLPRARGTLSLDVDRDDPQQVASGTLTAGLKGRVHWIAKLRAVRPGVWQGAIIYRDVLGTAFPYGAVEVRVNAAGGTRTAIVKFTAGAGSQPLVIPYRWVSPYFRQAEFEYDHVAGISPVTEIDPTAHPNHPADLHSEKLSIEAFYRRAGIDARLSPNPSAVPIGGAGANVTWSDAEMHDAMQAYWSRFANKPQWALWVFFANQHDTGPSLGGIMFDSIGPNDRQGTALFYNSFISQAPAGDQSPSEWVKRMRYWTAVHEMGHAFNLAHSWQKSLGTPWIPLQDEPEARSPMNYPYRVAGGERTFFADFRYRFSDPELLFLRHAPERFVEMGYADWFDHHAFEQAAAPVPGLTLELRTRPARKTFEFLEAIVLELKLTNGSDQPLLVPDRVLQKLEAMTFVVKRKGAPARQLVPCARRCLESRVRALAPGASIYDSVFVSFGRDGWLVDEPGDYLVQAAIHLDAGDIVSNRVTLRVELPAGRDEEVFAQDYFSDGVGRVLSFDGSTELVEANGVLLKATEALKGRAVATHAAVALGIPGTRTTKRLVFEPGDPRASQAEVRRVAEYAPNEKLVSRLATTLVSTHAIQTLGHVDTHDYIDRVSDGFDLLGFPARAAEAQAALHEALKAGNVAADVLQGIAARRDAFSAKAQGRKVG